MLHVEPTSWHVERDRRARELDQELPTSTFSDDVRRTLYRYALVRNSWGTTNIDSGPIELERVEQLYEDHERGYSRGGRTLPTDIEVLNYLDLVDQAPTEPVTLSPEDVRQLHRDYFRDVPLHNEAEPGRWKTRPNRVTNPFGTLETTAPEHVEDEVQALLQWLDGDAANLPLLVQGALFFHRFQQIHPFGDGNGRVGRLLTLYVLSSRGLPHIRYAPIDDTINQDRRLYYESLHEADEGDPNLWIGTFASVVVDGYRRSHLLGRRLQSIPPSLPQGSRHLLEWVYVHDVDKFQPKDVERFYRQASRSTRTRRLKELEDLGLLRGEGQGAGRRYHVRPLAETRGVSGEG